MLLDFLGYFVPVDLRVMNMLYCGHLHDGSEAMNAKKILTFAGVGLVLFFLIAEPQQAAQLVQNLLGTLKAAAEALITFVKSLF